MSLCLQMFVTFREFYLRWCLYQLLASWLSQWSSVTFRLVQNRLYLLFSKVHLQHFVCSLWEGVVSPALASILYRVDQLWPIPFLVWTVSDLRRCVWLTLKSQSSANSSSGCPGRFPVPILLLWDLLREQPGLPTLSGLSQLMGTSLQVHQSIPWSTSDNMHWTYCSLSRVVSSQQWYPLKPHFVTHRSHVNAPMKSPLHVHVIQTCCGSQESICSLLLFQVFPRNCCVRLQYSNLRS